MNTAGVLAYIQNFAKLQEISSDSCVHFDDESVALLSTFALDILSALSSSLVRGLYV